MSAPISKLRGVVTLVVATVAFAAALVLRQSVDPWRATALAAVIGIALSAWTLGPRLRPLLAIDGAGVARAIVLGAVLVGATHAAFAAVRAISPELAITVRGLYLSIEQGDSRIALALITTLIVTGEELVWRGVGLAIARAGSPLGCAVVSVALYVLPQLAGHVPVLIAAAIGLGAIFAAQRLVTGRLTDVIITHAIWSIAVFILLPVA